MSKTESSSEMKPWQHGYDLDTLKRLEREYEPYNRFTDSPFAKFRKDHIAAALHDKTLLIERDTKDRYVGSLVREIAKTTSAITMYGKVVVGNKRPGDAILTKLNGSASYKKRVLTLTHERRPCWLYVWAEDVETKKIVEDSGWSYVGAKITTFGEIYAIYFKDGEGESVGFVSSAREHPKIDATERVTLKKVAKCSVDLVAKIQKQLRKDAPVWTNHYSNYNKNGSWSALALRGYFADPSRIEKPEEMNAKWHEKHAGETFEMQDTPMRKDYPWVNDLLDFLDGDVHRVRFMRLAPGDGELRRHTDQVDPDAGGSLGQLARLHFPIVTNPNVTFTAWSPTGTRIDAHPKVGSVWYLDTRKPHRVVNAGDTERVHLVVDAVATPKLRRLLLKE